jgi:CRISPR-associated protein Cas1
LILRENGYNCEGGVAYYIGSRERVEVLFDDALVAQTRTLLSAARAAAGTPALPPPLVDSPKCPRCSLVGICLPDEVNALTHAPRNPGRVVPAPTRRLMPARDDALPVYVTEQGTMVGKSGETLEIRREREVLQTVRLIDVSQICLYGNILISAPTIYALTARGISICHFSHGGWFHSITHGMPSQNILLRQRQFAACGDVPTALSIGRLMIQGKIKNCRTMLRRNGMDVPVPVLDELARLADAAVLTTAMASLLGIEGAAARLYFGNFARMIKVKPDESLGAFDWNGRNRRPPMDPINALLSFVYALLVKDLTVAALAVGFDPFMGVYHQPHFGRASLALDLAEEFRPLLGDSVVLGLINTRELGPGDFLSRAGATMLTPSGRKRTIAAYERRMETTIRHPLFGYTVSYRRILEVQVRLLARHLLGEIPQYPPFRTR